MISYESLNTWSVGVSSSLANLRSVMTTSYSASLLVVEKENQRAYSRVTSSREIRMIPMLLVEDVEDPSMYRVHDGTFDIGFSAGSWRRASCMTSGSSSGRVHSIMKSVKI